MLLGCCIYHKVKKFGESDSDESDSDVDVAKSNSTKITNKKGSNIKPYQRHHA